MSALILVLPVILPIAGGALILWLPFRSDRARNLYAEILVCATSAAAFYAMLACPGKTATLYTLSQGFSLALRADGAASLFAGMVSLMWPLVMLYAFDYMEHAQRKHVFFAFYVMTFGVTLGVAFSANLTTLYVFYEMLSLVTLPLVVHYGNHESMYAGRVYAVFTIGGASLTFFAVIVATIYGNAGSFEFGGCMNLYVNHGLIRAAYLLAFLGFGTKAAVFPLYYWLPTASVAPTPVTALLHAVAVVNSGVFAVMRTTYYVFGTKLLLGSGVQKLCLALAVFTLLYASVMALRERHFKRRLAFSTVANLSYMLFGIELMTAQGMVGGMSHMVFHGVIKITLFLCAGAFMHRTGKNYIYELNGIGRRMPVTFICYTLGALSLTGIPFFCGFISKWKLLEAGAAAGTPLGTAGDCALIAAAFLCAMYTLTISVRAFFPVQGHAGAPQKAASCEAGVLMLLPILVFTAVNVVLGIAPGIILDFIGSIASGSI